MRALFLILVLANAAFFAWARWVDVRPDSGTPSRPASATAATRLALVPEPSPSSSERGTELSPAQSSAVSDRPLDVEAQVAEAACTSVGPFRTLNEAAAAAATLRAEGFAPRQRVESGEVWVGYWVSWRGAATREQAEAAEAMLAERGITDTYILPAGDAPNVLSLGVFTDRRRAERRREEVGLLGLDATISDRRQPGSVYWIDVDKVPGGATLDPGTLREGPGRIVRIETRPCTPISTPEGAAASEVSSGNGLPVQPRVPEPQPAAVPPPADGS